jgi:hypothetical protein
MGYSWKQPTRYVPSRPPDPEEEHEAHEELEALKKGSKRRLCPEAPQRERLVIVPAPTQTWTL